MKISEIPADELVRRCANGGDSILWGEFVRRFQKLIAISIIRAAESRGGVRADIVEDLVQETYAKLCANDCSILRGFVPNHPDAVFGFVKVIAANVAHDYFRSFRARKRGSGDQPIEAADAEQIASSEAAIQMERNVMFAEIDCLLNHQAESSNAQRDRAIFWLYYLQGLSARAIAALPSVELSVKGVESTLLRLSKSIRQHFNSSKSRSPLSHEFSGGNRRDDAL